MLMERTALFDWEQSYGLAWSTPQPTAVHRSAIRFQDASWKRVEPRNAVARACLAHEGACADTAQSPDPSRRPKPGLCEPVPREAGRHPLRPRSPESAGREVEARPL